MDFAGTTAPSSEESTNSLPRISIVTPSFNQGQFLEVCIQSVINQNYPSLEYIIIDGGSTDNSLEIIKKYEANLSFWISEPDQGQSDALNKGFGRATGDLVAWLNSDDYYLPGVFTKLVNIYQKHPTAPFFFGNGLRVNEQGETKRIFFPKNALFFSREALGYGLNYILQPATFIRRKSLEQVGYLSTTLKYGMDTDLWLRLSVSGDPIPIQAQLAASREYDKTKTATGSFARIEELRQIAEKHLQTPITPGTICYFLDTLYQFVQEENNLFPPKYQRDILRFWAETSLLMERFGAGPDGFPIPPHNNSFFFRLKRRTWVRLRNLFKKHPSLYKRFGKE